MTVNKINSDSRNRSYTDRIIFTNYALFEDIAKFLGHARLKDLASISDISKPKPTLNNRILILQKMGIQDVYAKTICSDNNSQLDFIWRTHKSNRHAWHKDIEYAKKNLKNKKAQYRALKAELNLRKTNNGPTYCLGGRKLWYQAQNDPLIMSEFKKKRYWCGAIGRSDFTRKDGSVNHYFSNQMIRFNSYTNEVSIIVPKALWSKYSLTKNSSRVVIGTCNFHYGKDKIEEKINLGESITFHIQYVNGHWKLRAQLRLPKILVSNLSSKQRVLGIDTNAGHIDASIVDNFGNPIKHFTFTVRNKGMQVTVEKMFKVLKQYNITAVYMEKLSGLQRDSTRKGYRSYNKKISEIKSGKLKTILNTYCEDHNLSFDLVNPYGTSKYTIDWKDVCLNAKDIHQIASFLIARRGLGFEINRTVINKKKLLVDSGRSTIVMNDSKINNSEPGDNVRLLLDSVPF